MLPVEVVVLAVADGAAEARQEVHAHVQPEEEEVVRDEAGHLRCATRYALVRYARGWYARRTYSGAPRGMLPCASGMCRTREADTLPRTCGTAYVYVSTLAGHHLGDELGGTGGVGRAACARSCDRRHDPRPQQDAEPVRAERAEGVRGEGVRRLDRICI